MCVCVCVCVCVYVCVRVCVCVDALSIHVYNIMSAESKHTVLLQTCVLYIQYEFKKTTHTVHANIHVHVPCEEVATATGHVNERPLLPQS